jgi:glucokinase
MPALMTSGYILSGDLGATKTNLTLYDLSAPISAPQSVATFQNFDYSGLHAILREYLAGKPGPIVAACFGIAGPVIDNHVRMVNLNWEIDAAELCAEFGFKAAWLINDLKALANAVPVLQPSDLDTLNAGIPEERGPIGVIAPGTGLGIGYLTWAAGRYHAQATEGGHASFAPETKLQEELLAHLRGKFKQVAIEHVCAGVGLPNVYGFLKDAGKAIEPAWLTAELAAARDDTRVIVENALAAKPGSEICQMTLRLFVEILGAQAGNIALGFGAIGGVYVGGGIPPRILEELRAYGFMQFFLGKIGYESYLKRFPVHVILKPESALVGAAEYGRQQLASE